MWQISIEKDDISNVRKELRNLKNCFAIDKTVSNLCKFDDLINNALCEKGSARC